MWSDAFLNDIYIEWQQTFTWEHALVEWNQLHHDWWIIPNFVCTVFFLRVVRLVASFHCKTAGEGKAIPHYSVTSIYWFAESVIQLLWFLIKLTVFIVSPLNLLFFSCQSMFSGSPNKNDERFTVCAFKAICFNANLCKPFAPTCGEKNKFDLFSFFTRWQICMLHWHCFKWSYYTKSVSSFSRIICSLPHHNHLVF